MNEHVTTTRPGTDGLWRWLLGGLLGGAVVLGLLIAAYAIGYHRGQGHARATAAAPTTTAAAPTTTAAAPPTALGPVTPSPALVSRGKTLYTADGCAACHSLTGAAGAGPALNGIAGSKVTLTDGQTVTADDTYLEQAITNPDAQIAKGYRPGLMTAAVAGYDLARKPDDVRALVAFIKARS